MMPAMKVRDLVEANSVKFSPSNRRMDGSGDWHLVDRYTGTVYKRGLPSKAAAYKWASRMNMPAMSEAAQTRAVSCDPIATAYMREHPDTVLISD